MAAIVERDRRYRVIRMRAIRLHAPGGPEELVSEELDVPQAAPGEVLVRVHAAAITRDELEWPVDRLPAIPSYEVSGVTEASEAVYGLTGFDRDGAAAEYAVVPARFLAPKPRTIDHVEAAALPLAGLTVMQGLYDHGGLARGHRVLIHGAAGGVGHLAVQLAHGNGAHVIATASTEHVESVRALGADEVIDHTAGRFEDAVEPVDLVFDTAGGDRLTRSPAVIREGGRLVSVAVEPPEAPGIASIYFVVEPSREQLIELARLVDDGGLRPAIDTVFALDDARRAFERANSREGRGKVVLRVAGD
jgi:NADPH:quinone reductase-like Zn-dependent oxidoreductase